MVLKNESQFSWALNTSSEGPKTQVATWNKQYSIILQIVETCDHSQNLSFGLHVSVAGHETWVQLASLTSSAKPLPATWQIINSFVLIVNDNKSWIIYSSWLVDCPYILKLAILPNQVHQFPQFLLLWNLQREAAHKGGQWKMHFLITPQSPKSKIYCIHYFKGFCPVTKVVCGATTGWHSF